MLIRVIIFDFDGVIIDDESLHFELFNKVLDEKSISPLSWNDYIKRYISMSDEEVFESELERNERDLNVVDEMVEQKSKYYDQMKADLKPFPGITKAIRKLAERYVLAIGTRARRGEVESFVRKESIGQKFKVIVAAEDFEKDKPDPECFRKALELINTTRSQPIIPDECIVIEDSPDGIRAAKNAGMKCLAVTNTFPKKDLILADAIMANDLLTFFLGESHKVSS